MGRLTPLQIRNLKEPGRYNDGDGLYLELTGQNKGNWQLRATVNGRRRDIGLGSLALVSLKEARDAAFEMRRDIQRGIDPVAERKRRKIEILTFKAAALRVHAEQKASWKNGKHQDQWITTLENYAFPLLGECLLCCRVPNGAFSWNVGVSQAPSSGFENLMRGEQLGHDRRTFVAALVLATFAGCSAGRGVTRNDDWRVRRLRHVEETAHGRLGVYVLDTQSNKGFGWRENERFAHCSSFKMSLAAMVLSKADHGDAYLGEVLRWRARDRRTGRPDRAAT